MTNVKHGHAVNNLLSPTYVTWHSMKQRCRDKNHSAYFKYGGRGITFCDRWLNFNNFLCDMGERPTGKTLDRINNNGNYEPTNCKWSTKKEQARNTRKNRYIDFNGKKITIAELSDKIGVNQGVLRGRINNGYSMDKVLSKDLFKRGMKQKYFFKDFSSINDVGKYFGISHQRVSQKLKNGWIPQKTAC
jgi:hypothetical protein